MDCRLYLLASLQRAPQQLRIQIYAVCVFFWGGEEGSSKIQTCAGSTHTSCCEKV